MDFSFFLLGGGLFDEPAAPAPPTPVPEVEKPKTPVRNDDDSDDGGHHMDAFGGAPSPGGMSSMGGSRPVSPAGGEQPNSNAAAGWEAPAPTMDETPQVSDIPETPAADQTTLVNNEAETFALAPVDASAIRGMVRTKRKRKLVVDEVKAIAGK